MWSSWSPAEGRSAKEAFKIAAAASKNVRFEGRGDIQEIRVFDEWAYFGITWRWR